MCRTARALFIASMLLPSIGVFGQQGSFFDDPPRGFYSRTSMDDCVQRFYSEPEEFHSSFGVHGVFRVYPGEFRHMVAIGRIWSNGSINYFCGGSLITDDFILTAAHCTVDHDNIAPNTVRIGDTDVGSEEDEYAEYVEIGRIIVHPQYRKSRRYFDIALIQLAEPIRFSAAVCPACLWREPSLPPDRMESLAFSTINSGSLITLMRMKVENFDLFNCDEKIGLTYSSRRELPDGIRDDQFCVNRERLENRDTSGPIGVKRLTVGGFVVPLVVGTVSFTVHDRSAELIEVYTKISSYIDWIEREVNQTLTGEECSKGLSCLRPQHSTVTIADFPKHKSLQRFGLIWNDTAPSLYECGATLIDYQYLLTSASCVTTNRGGPSYVSYDGKERIAVQDVYVSPKYVRRRPENDIALVKIAKFTNPKVHRPSCLWNRRTDGEWSTLPVFSAYGLLVKFLSWFSSELVNRTISIRPLYRKDCIADSARDSDLFRCNEVNMVPRLCSLDYGGPVTNDKYKPEDPNYIYGIVSSLSKDCTSKLFITDVTPHIDWIEDIIISQRDTFSGYSLVPSNMRA